MKKNTILFSILLIFIVSLATSCVFSENTTNYVNNVTDISDNQITVTQNDLQVVSDDVPTTSQEYTIHKDSNSSAIQDTINKMNNGDKLNFENGTYNDICIYINKDIIVNGNGATLNGYQNPGVNNNNIPSIITNTTANGGYAINQFATVYIINTNKTIFTGFTVAGLNSTTYSNAAIYAQNNKNLTISNNIIEGSSWGLYITSSPDVKVFNNYIKNQATTGVLAFGSTRALIKNNTVVNAKNHGIDVRHGTGANAVIVNNTVIGSKEGIYLMHSKGHIAENNTLINNTISGITCYGSGEIKINNNNFIGGRLAVLLGSGFYNITIGENNYKLANLPYPPTFVYYVGIADSTYQTPAASEGTYTDNSNDETLPAYTSNITVPTPKDITVNYDKIIKPTGVTYNVPEGTSSADIQKMINGMNNGDTLEFAKNAVYNDICIYVDKNIKIIGNGATLNGYKGSEAINKNNIPDKIKNPTKDGGYAISQYAVLYLANNSNAVVYNLHVVGHADGYSDNNVNATTETYKTVDIFANECKNLTITNCTVKGNSWGIFLNYCPNALISNNLAEDIYTTGIMNFGSGNSIIANNTVNNAKNHGIDVRHGTGPNVTVVNNTITDAKEGIYLMHSKGHMVYNNTILNSKLSGITAYGSGDEYIFNNTIKGSRIGFILGGGYYNVTLNNNTYILDQLPYPPTFVYYVVTADSKYQSQEKAEGIYSDIKFNPRAVIIVENTIINNNGNVTATLKDTNGQNLANEELIFTINNQNYTAITDENGVATIKVNNLANGTYPSRVTFLGNKELESNYQDFQITVVNSTIEDLNLNAPNIEMYYENGTRFTVIVTDKDNKPIDGINITITLNGVSYTKLVENGTASLGIHLNPGVYNANVVYNGTKYTYNSVNATITILSTIVGQDITKYFRNGTQFEVQVFDAHGNPVANQTVKFNINGKFYNKETDEKGIAKLNINLNPGKYIITSTYNGCNVANNISVLSTIVGQNMTKYFRNGTQYNVQVFDANGNPAANQTVKFNINGVFYTKQTNKDGIATLNINLNPGEYVITATYNGCNVANTIKVLPTIKSENIEMTNKNRIPFTANVLDGQGNPAVNQSVKFNINGIIYNKISDANGDVKLNINLNIGKYIITTEYNGLKVSNTVTVKN